MGALEALTPYVMLAFGVINGLLGMVYMNMREQQKTDKAASERQIELLRGDLKAVETRFEKFRAEELTALTDKIDTMKDAVTQGLNDLRLALAENYVKKHELVELTKKIDRAIASHQLHPPNAS